MPLRYVLDYFKYVYDTSDVGDFESPVRFSSLASGPGQTTPPFHEGEPSGQRPSQELLRPVPKTETCGVLMALRLRNGGNIPAIRMPPRFQWAGHFFR